MGGGGSASGIEVETVTIDELLRKAHSRLGADFDVASHSCVFMKIDAEGDDPDVLEGASQLLRDNKLLGILVEEHDHMLQLKGHSPRALRNLLQGFEIIPLVTPSR